MGLMDNIKKAQKMAQQAAQTGGAGQMSPSAGDVDIAVSVDLENGQSFDTTVFQYLTDDAVKAYQPGGKFEIKADPDNTSKMMLYGRALTRPG
jgi:hypothetical protein